MCQPPVRRPSCAIPGVNPGVSIPQPPVVSRCLTVACCDHVASPGHSKGACRPWRQRQRQWRRQRRRRGTGGEAEGVWHAGRGDEGTRSVQQSTLWCSVLPFGNSVAGGVAGDVRSIVVVSVPFVALVIVYAYVWCTCRSCCRCLVAQPCAAGCLLIPCARWQAVDCDLQRLKRTNAASAE